MAKKKKKRVRKKSGSSLANLSSDELKKNGEQYLHSQKFQDAIKCFKELLKHDESGHAASLLTEAYKGRVKVLTAKSMVKEALVLLDVMARYCGQEEIAPLRMILQLKSCNYLDAAKIFRTYHTQLDRKKSQELETLFGALLLTDSGLGAEDFPAKSPLVKHLPMALAALQHCGEDKPEETKQALQEIPFRSPYRDLRTLITGLIHWQNDQDKAADFFRKIQASSPYFQYATRFLAGFEKPASILKKIAATPLKEQQKICGLYGLTGQQFRGLTDFTKAGDQPVKLHNLVKKHAKCFSIEEQNKLFRQILPFTDDDVGEILLFHNEINFIEKSRLAALAMENGSYFIEAAEHWDDYLEELDRNSPNYNKKMALGLRHQAELIRKNDYPNPPPPIFVEKMLESLKFDPNHVATWLMAAEVAGRFISVSKKYQIINDAVAQLPQNVDILLAGIKAAGQRNAHKKAGLLAKRVLKIDPINTSALDFLTESNLEHARKLAFQEKWLLAEKELDQTDTRVKAIRLRGRRLIGLGMIFLLQDKKEGYQLITSGKEENGTVILGHLLTSTESRLYEMPKSFQDRFDKELHQAANSEFNQMEFLRIISWLLSFSKKQFLMLKDSCQLLKKYFSKATKFPWSREEGLSICKNVQKIAFHFVYSSSACSMNCIISCATS